MIGELLAGSASIGSVQPQGFTSEHVEIVREVAHQLAIALNKNRLDAALQEHARLLEQRILERTDELASAKERIEAILQSASDALIVVQLNGHVEQVNPAFTALFDMTLEPEQPLSLYSLVDADSVEGLRVTLDAIIAEGTGTRVELMAKRRDGTLFPADAAISPVVDGTPAFLICTIRDVSLYKQAELRLRHALDKEKELNALKTSFVSIVSHEFRTPLAVILSSTELLTEYSDRMDPNRRQEKLVNIAC